MVVQVGDTVLVYGAGTPWAFAKKIEPAEVGDTVDVVTLSDGTKLAMPKIELDLSEYVWVIPEWDTPFNLGDLPFNWGLIPLGAAVFTVTGVSCWEMTDDLREWDAGSLNGFFFVPITGKRKGNLLEILSNSEQVYTLKPLNDPHGPMDQDLNQIGTVWAASQYSEVYWWYQTVAPVDEGGVVYFRCNDRPKFNRVYANQNVSYIMQQMNASMVRQIRVLMRGYTTNCSLHGASKHVITVSFSGSSAYSSSLQFTRVLTGEGADKRADLYAKYGILTDSYAAPNYSVIASTDWPEYTEYVFDVPESAGIDAYDVMFRFMAAKLHDDTGSSWEFHELHVWVDSIRFYDGDGNEISEPCIGGIHVGDKYVIYNPTTKRLVFNDATKLLTSANWQTGGEGAVIITDPIEYVWDGQGYVYLTSSKTTFSTIQFDDLLRVQSWHGETVRTIDFHLGERITVSGETVSRELTNITSILKAGKNTITLTAKNQDGTKVGFVTAIYVKRNMTAVSL